MVQTPKFDIVLVFEAPQLSVGSVSKSGLSSKCKDGKSVALKFRCLKYFLSDNCWRVGGKKFPPPPIFYCSAASAKKWNKKIPGALQLSLTQLSFGQNFHQLAPKNIVLRTQK